METPKDFNPLALDNQLCFSLYVCSKEIIRRYQPLLEPLGLTYTMYITLLSLWEKDRVTVKDLGQRLFLDSGTLTPVLKKMEKNALITRSRSQEDERNVLICLTDEGRNLKNKCADIPRKMACTNILDLQKAPKLLTMLHEMMEKIADGDNESSLTVS